MDRLTALPTGQSTQNGTRLDAVNRFPAQVQLPACRQNAGFLEPINHMGLEGCRKTTTPVGPRNLHRHNSMLGTRNTGNLANQVRLVTMAVQMTPSPVPVVVAGTFPPTLGARQGLRTIVGNVYQFLLPLGKKFKIGNLLGT